MTRRPLVALAMFPWAAENVFGANERLHLARVADVVDETPLHTFADDRAAKVLREAEVLLTCWGTPGVDDRTLELAPKLEAIVHAAGTVKGFVGDACWERGVRVTSVAVENAKPVAEYTLAAIIMANKNAFLARETYQRTRTMPRKLDAPVPGNMAKRVGIIGASRVGRRVLELLRNLDVEPVVSDPLLTADEAARLGATLVELDDLLATSDVVSVHAPLLPETTGMIDARRLGLIRDGVTLINTARGAIIDSAALEAELVSGRINAVIDTTHPEPLPSDSPLLGLPNLFLTPHLAGAQGTELARLAGAAIDEVERFARGEAFAYEIHRADLPWIA